MLRLADLRARLRAGAASAAFVGRVLRGTGLGSALRLRGLPSFVHAARAARLGPHLPVVLHAHMSPDKECVVAAELRLTWRQLDQEANRLAHVLVARGGAGDRVVCLLPNGGPYLIAQQALARIGAVAVQVNPRATAAELAYILGNAEPAVALVDAAFLETFLAAQELAGDRARLIVAGAAAPPRRGDRWDEATAAAPADRGPVAVEPGGGAIVYTSGTTGKPKGAARSFRQTGLAGVADMMLQVGMHTSDRHLVTCPLYHSAAPAFVAIMMSIGATCVVMPSFEPEAALALIARERITCALVVPTMLVRITALPAEVRRRHDTSSLRWVMSAAAPLPTEVARRFQDQFGQVLWNFYGATETGVVTLAGPADHGARPGTVGRPVRGNEIRLLDDDGAAVAPGAVGALYVRNAMLIGGYHKNPEATARSMRDGFFSVGDLARVDADGYYYLESRKHDMVISGGVNIYPREIEDRLAAHPAILDVAVVGIPDAEWGERLRAFVVVRPGMTLGADEVIDWCRGALADYKRPRQVVFVDELPRTPTGKVLKRELRERAL